MKSSETDKLFAQAETLRQKSRYTESLAFLKQALKLYASSRDSIGVMECHLSTGDVCRMIGDFDSAVKSYTAAIKTAKKLHDISAIADAEAGIGLSLRAKGDWKKALKMISSAMDYYQSMDDKQGIAFSLWATAGTLRIQGDILKAIDTFKQALKAFKALKQQTFDRILSLRSRGDFENRRSLQRFLELLQPGKHFVCGHKRHLRDSILILWNRQRPPHARRL